MARADLLTNLIKAEKSGDKKAFRRTVESLIADERDKNHHVLADRLTSIIQAPPTCQSEPPSAGWDNRVQRLFYELEPSRSLDELVLPDLAKSNVREVVEEQHRADVLHAHGLEPRHRIMCIGRPGTGKTSLAEALAFDLMVPMFVVRYEGLIGKYLGETNDRLRKLLEFAATRRCVLFFDEFDAIGKERGDENDTGEIKRIVSSLLLQLDSLPSHVVVFVASNHPELLDRAVWRRFQLRIKLPMPSARQRELWMEELAKYCDASLGSSPKTLAQKLEGLSFAELEDFSADVKRRFVLAAGDADLKKIVASKVKQWSAVSESKISAS